MNRVESNQWLRLVWTEGMTFSFTKDLLKAFGLPEKIFAASQAELSDVVPFPIAKRLAAKVDPLIEARLVSALDWLEATPSASLVTLADTDYPIAFFNVPEPPVVFFCQGRRELMTRRTLSFIGASHPTQEGLETLEAWIREIRKEPILLCETTQEGVALEALKIAQTVRMPACVFPRQALAQRKTVNADNLYLTIDPAGNDPEADRKLYAGFCENFVMLEDTLYSANLKFVRELLDLNKTVMAVPGSVHSPLSRAPHKLLKEGARLVENAADVLDAMRNTLEVI